MIKTLVYGVNVDICIFFITSVIVRFMLLFILTTHAIFILILKTIQKISMFMSIQNIWDSHSCNLTFFMLSAFLYSKLSSKQIITLLIHYDADYIHYDIYCDIHYVGLLFPCGDQKPKDYIRNVTQNNIFLKS